MLLDKLRSKSRIEALVRQYGARHVRVFGSVARREERPDSDVVSLVDFPLAYGLFTRPEESIHAMLAQGCGSGNGYPPDVQLPATETVLKQDGMIADNLAG